MLKRFKQIVLKPSLWAFLSKVLLELAVRTGTVYCWNWIVTDGVNMTLFGEPKLGVIKGVILLSIIYITIGYSAIAANNETEK